MGKIRLEIPTTSHAQRWLLTSFKYNHPLVFHSITLKVTVELRISLLCLFLRIDFQLLTSCSLRGRLSHVKIELFPRGNQKAFQWRARSALVMIARLKLMYSCSWSKARKGKISITTWTTVILNEKRNDGKKWFHSLNSLLGLVPLLFPVAVSRPHAGVL